MYTPLTNYILFCKKKYNSIIKTEMRLFCLANLVINIIYYLPVYGVTSFMPAKFIWRNRIR